MKTHDVITIEEDSSQGETLRINIAMNMWNDYLLRRRI